MPEERKQQPQSDDSSEKKKIQWTMKDRLLIYGLATFIGLAIGIGLITIYFRDAFEINECKKQAWQGGVVRESKDPGALKMLFIGNSLLYHASVPHQFATIYESKLTRPLKIYQILVPGESLEGHLKTGIAQKFIEKMGPWDIVIIQEWSGGPAKTLDSMQRSGAELIKITKNSGAQPYLFMTYADKGKFEDQKVVSSAYTDLGKEYDVPVIPDGDLFFFAQREIPDIELYSPDNHHPSEKGSYLGALLTFSMLTGESPEGTPSEVKWKGKREIFLSKLSEEEHQQIVKTVKKFVAERKPLQSGVTTR